MRRRELIRLFSGAMTTLPINLRGAAQALQSAHIGFISSLDQPAAVGQECRVAIH
jgi:hypothetical protein